MTFVERFRELVALLPAGSSITLPVADLTSWLAAEATAAAVPVAVSKPAAEHSVDEWLTAKQCAERLHVSPRWVLEHGELLGRHTLTPRCVRFSARALGPLVPKVPSYIDSNNFPYTVRPQMASPTARDS